MSESEDRLIAYLLGELAEAENARIEEQYLADEASLAPLMAIEAELYDAYARDSLPSERRRLFEQRFLVTPEQRWQLEFSRTLLRVPRPEQRASWIRLQWPRVAALAAVAVALGIAIEFWWPATRQLPLPQIAQQAPPARPQVVISFELGSGITRDGGEEPTVEIPANADLVRITARADHDLPPSYGAVLREPDGTEVWRNDAIRHTAGDAKSAIVEIPAAPLPAGHYILTLHTTNQNGVSEDIADYAFRVRKP